MVERLPRLSNEETIYYFQKLQNGGKEAKAAKEKLAAHYFCLIEIIAQKLSSNPDIINDLIGEGHRGLSEAINDFDINKGVSFFSFAWGCIQKQMFTYFKRTKKQRLELSLDAPINDGDIKKRSFYEQLPDKNIIDVEEEVIKKTLYNELYMHIEKLSFLYRKVAKLLYGLNGNRKHSYSEISKIFGLSFKQIDNMHTRILRNLRISYEEKSSQRINYETEIYNHFLSLDFEQFLSLYGNQYKKLNDYQKEFFKMFYNVVDPDILNSNIDLKQIEEQINMTAFPFSIISSELSEGKLLLTYTQNKENFNEYQQDIIKHYLLKKITLDELLSKYNKPIDFIESTWRYLKVKLELMHLGINEKELDKKTIKSILNDSNYNINDLHRTIITMYYDLNGYRRYRLVKIIKILNLDVHPDYIKEVLLNIKKYEIGIKKSEWYTYEQLLDYYINNKDKLTVDDANRIKTCLNFRKKITKNKNIDIVYSHSLPFKIEYDLACYLYGKIIDLDNMTPLQIIGALSISKIDYFYKALLVKKLGYSTRYIIKNNDKRKLLKMMIEIYEKRKVMDDEEYQITAKVLEKRLI